MKERTDEAIIRAWEASKNLRIWLRVAEADGEFSEEDLADIRGMLIGARSIEENIDRRYMRKLSK